MSTDEQLQRGDAIRIRPVMGRITLRGFDADAFAAARARLRLSRGELGRLASPPPPAPPITDVVIGRWERRKTSPDIGLLARVLPVLKLDAAQVIRVPEDERLLTDWRNLKLLTQAQLAEAARISQDLLSRLERGQRALQPAVAEALAAALGIPVEEVFAAYDRARQPADD